MAPLPVELLYGVYLGLLTGVIPALIAWGLGFIVRYITGIALPGVVVAGVGMALAGINGGLLALANAEYTAAGGLPVAVAIIVVLMMALYAHSKADAMALTFPRRVSLRRLRERKLTADVVELVGGRGEVTVTVTQVTDLEGYPPLSPALREALRIERRLPADLPIDELERRLVEILHTEFDVAEAAVTIDERGRATVAAAPPLSGVSKRVPVGKRAVSVETRLPTGLTSGDEVVIDAPALETPVEGTVVSAGKAGTNTIAGGAAGTHENPPGEASSAAPATAPVTAGGEGRITVAATPGDARRLLDVDRARVTVRPRGIHTEYELMSLLRRAGRPVRQLAVGGGALDGRSLGEADVREEFGVAVLAVRSEGAGGWAVAPSGDTRLRAGDELFAAGPRDALDRFAAVIGG